MKKDTLKLFKVNLKGLSSVTGVNYQSSYVVAKDPTEAYKMVRDFLDTEDLGFPDDRELDFISLLAEDYKYTDVRTLLFGRFLVLTND